MKTKKLNNNPIIEDGNNSIAVILIGETTKEIRCEYINTTAIGTIIEGHIGSGHKEQIAFIPKDFIVILKKAN